jgi:hypothetical protein
MPTSPEAVIWKNPPEPLMSERQGGRSLWAPLLAELRERPGQWALIRSYEKKRTAFVAVNDLKRGRIAKSIEPREYEFTVRSTLEGGGDIYGRYLNELPMQPKSEAAQTERVPCPYGFHRTVCVCCGRCQCFDHTDHGGYSRFITAHKYDEKAAGCG